MRPSEFKQVAAAFGQKYARFSGDAQTSSVLIEIEPVKILTYKSEPISGQRSSTERVARAR